MNLVFQVLNLIIMLMELLPCILYRWKNANGTELMRIEGGGTVYITGALTYSSSITATGASFINSGIAI